MNAKVNVKVPTPIEPMDVYDHLTQAREIIGWMEALGYSIQRANENGATHYSTRLAGLIHYLGTDWTEHFNREAEKLLKEQERD